MDEEQNNNEQNLGDKINDGVQDTKNAVKDGANLGKNVATGNVLGAIKDGFKLLGNKTARKTILIAVLIPIIVIVALASSIYAIFDGIGSKVQDVISKIENLFTVDWDNGNGAITISDEAIDEIIATIESTGVDLADLKLMGDVEDNAIDKESEEYKEVLRKYIRKFYEAQVVTETLNTNPGWFEEYILNGGKTYGAVYVYRPKDVEVEETVENLEKDQLKYMSYEKMQEKATNGKINDIKGYFSVKDGKLVIPEWITTTVSKSKSKSTNITLNTNITLREIEYKSLITQYTTPMNFFIYLTMISQNPEFVAAVTELVKGSEIHLTVLDTETTNIEDEIYTYTTHTKGSSVSYEDITDDYGNVISTKKVVTPINTSSSEEENTKTTITTVIPAVKVTHVKTWFCEQDITYVKKELEPYHDSYVLDSSNDATLADDPEPAEPPEGSTVSWITDRKKNITVDTTGTTYEEGIRGDVVDKTNDFIKLLDIKYKLPNTNRYEAAGKSNMVSGAEMLFSLMQKDSGLQNLEQVMRYILGKYANKDFGVESLDFSIFNAKDFKNVSSSNALKEFLHHFEGTKEENGQYIVYKDSGGNRTVGYGINIEAQGSRFISRGIDPSTIKEGDKLDKELVDSIEDEILAGMQSSVEAATSGMNLKTYQIIVLVSRMYNCGNISGFKDAYNKYWNESDDEYGVPENASMYEHNLYQKYMYSPIKDNKGNVLEGLIKRRKAEWILFKTGYNVATGGFIAEGGAIIECAQKIHQYMEKNSYSYCVYNCNGGEECTELGRGSCYLASTFEASKVSIQTRKTCCATYVSWVLQEAGYLQLTECYNSATSLVSILEGQKGFTRVSKSELEAGDIVVCSGHVEIYAGDGQVYNAGSGNAIRNAAPSSRTNLNKCLYGLRAQ